MPATVQREFLAVLKENSEDYDHIILGTFGFQPVFFEDVILDILQSKDASTILALIDSSHYEQTFKTARNAGTSYFIEPISHRLFHPKFILMTSETSGTLIISSANMTENGLIIDGEVFTEIDYVSSISDQSLPIFLEMRDFLNSLVTKGYVKSDKHKEHLLKTLQVPWLNKELVGTNEKNTHILHNLDNAILPQIKELLSGNEVSKVKILSPFFDSEGRALKYLSNNFSGQIELYLQPDRAYNVPIQTINSLVAEEKLKIYKTAFKSNPNRYIHAKIILFETKNGSFCLTGSANNTYDALLLNSTSGNVELSLLRYEKEKTAFQYLLNNSELSLEEISPNELRPNVESPAHEREAVDFYIEDAKLEGNKLIVKYVPQEKEFEDALVEIYRSSAPKPRLLNGIIKENGLFIENLSEETAKYCEQSAYLTLTLSNKASCKLVSNKRWISTEMLEKFPRKREIRLIERTHGREGFITLLNKLDDASDLPAILLYYLRFLNFDQLETLEEARKRFVQKTDQNQSESEAQIYSRFVLDAEDVLNAILISHEKKFLRLVETIDINRDIPEEARNIFDFFIFINKIIIWFIMRKNTSQSNVLKIINRMKILVGTNKRYWYYQECTGYFQRLSDKIGSDSFLRIYDSLDIFPQFILLTMVILELTRSQPEERRMHIKKHLSYLLQNASFNDEEENGLVTVSKEKIKKAITEYKEFENLSFSSDSIREIKEILKVKVKEGFCRSCRKLTRYHINSDEYLCPNCAKELVKSQSTYLALMLCPKCGYAGWQAISMKGPKPMLWCPRNGMKREEIETKFYVPV